MLKIGPDKIWFYCIFVIKDTFPRILCTRQRNCQKGKWYVVFLTCHAPIDLASMPILNEHSSLPEFLLYFQPSCILISSTTLHSSESFVNHMFLRVFNLLAFFLAIFLYSPELSNHSTFFLALFLYPSELDTSCILLSPKTILDYSELFIYFNL